MKALREAYGDCGHSLNPQQRKMHKPLGGGGSVGGIRCVSVVDQQTRRITARLSNLENLALDTSESLNVFVWKISTEYGNIEVKTHLLKYILQSSAKYRVHVMLESDEPMEEQCYLWWLHVHNACCRISSFI